MTGIARRAWCTLGLASLLAIGMLVGGCSKAKNDEEAREKSVEAGKAIGMKQAEMMKQGKMGTPKSSE